MTVVALAGRRVDAADARERRFPSANIEVVRTRLRAEFTRLQITAVVASAAAGVDLLGLDEGQRLGARTVVILPFEKDRFAANSVDDRSQPARWSSLYHRILSTSDVETLAEKFTLDEDAYAAATRRIVERAAVLGEGGKSIAIAVWDGRSRGKDDNSDYFVRYAKERGLSVVEVSTLA